MNIEILDVEQNYQDEQTTVWFEVDGENYGVCFEYCSVSSYAEKLDDGFSATMLNVDACPICNSDNKNAEIWAEILPAAQKAMKEEA